MFFSVGAMVALASMAVFADYWVAIPKETAATYVGRESCAQCHQSEVKAFTNSHHDLAMDVATDASVQGDFNNATLEHDGMTSRMFRDGKRFMVHTEGPTGAMEDFEVKYVFGVDPLQQYMVEFDRDASTQVNEIARVQVLRISWDTQKKRWFYLRPPDVSDKLAPDDPLHWTGIAQRWQTMCADCHSTNLRTNFDVATGKYHTTFSEIDVSCEACHGPASMHVQLANAKSLFWDRNHGYGLNVLKSESSEPQLQTCAQCHSRRGLITDQPSQGGATYHEHFAVETFHPDTYFDDGQIKDEVYVYGSFTQSLMYHKGIRCTDCHDPHSLQLKHPGNETCTSCHQHPAGKYDVPSHHHHAAGSEGAKCVNCHMPGRTYMDVDFRRDHSLRIPRPDLSVRHGTPNACADCHVKDQLAKVSKDELSDEVRDSLREYADWLRLSEKNDVLKRMIDDTNKWCDEACDRWYGEARKRPEHFGEAIAAHRQAKTTDQRQTAAEKLKALAARRDGVTPFLARATALEELSSGATDGYSDTARAIVEDTGDHPVVRAAAVRCLSNASAATLRRVLVPRLDDGARQVRLAAAQTLASPNVYAGLTGNERTRVDLALREYQSSMSAIADRSGSHLSWGILCEQRGMDAEAIKAYETAIRIEPTVAGARTNLAALLERIGQRGDAGSQWARDRAVALRAQELPLLRRDAGLAPENATVQYRYGLALYLSGDHPGALEKLESAAKLAPDVEDFQAAATMLREQMNSSTESDKPATEPE